MKSFLFYSASICIFQVAVVLFCGEKENQRFFSRRWRGGCFSFGQMALRSARARGRAGFFFKLVLAPVARGGFSFSVKWLALRAGQRQGGVFRIPPPYLWTPLSPQRVKGCSPLTSPKKKSKPKNASRFAKRIFWASPVYGSADGVTLSQNFTFSKGVKSAAKQQIGETRKKR